MKTYTNLSIPHPFPYQGSKRNIAKHILPFFPADVDVLFEPFCGAAAISIAACAYGLANKVVLNDLNSPLMDLWKEILERPSQLVDKYEKLWIEQQPDRKAFFFQIRDEFNKSHQSHHLLYLLARIVKGSVRYSSEGNFNQSADNRRFGMRPFTMRKNIIAVSKLLHKKTTIKAVDFRDVISKAEPKDLIYMDPPYQGTSHTRDHRYYEAWIQVVSATG
jgi:DNA adenine methylase